MRRLVFVILAFAMACSRETPAPPPPSSDSTPTTAPSTPPTASAPVPVLQTGTYDEAQLWFRSTKQFHFALDDSGVHAEGDVTRSTPGAEKVRFRANGTEWLAEAGPRGVTWKRREGGAWKPTDSPEFGPRIYQRVTLPFDPQKKEGVPLLAAEEGNTNLYRFTDANTGEVHEWWVKKADGAVERIKIGEKVDLKITVM
jgi:hypothetical protein